MIVATLRVTIPRRGGECGHVGRNRLCERAAAGQPAPRRAATLTNHLLAVHRPSRHTVIKVTGHVVIVCGHRGHVIPLAVRSGHRWRARLHPPSVIAWPPRPTRTRSPWWSRVATSCRHAVTWWVTTTRATDTTSCSRRCDHTWLFPFDMSTQIL